MFSISGILDEKKYRDTIQTIVLIFESTRILQKLQSWKPETVHKAFKWADIMIDLEAWPSDEKRSIVDSYFSPKFYLYDLAGTASEMMFLPAMKTIHITFWVILTSPFLNCNPQANRIFTEVMKQTHTRLGTVETQRMITTLMKYLASRNRFDELYSQLQIPLGTGKPVSAQNCLFAYQFTFAYALFKSRISNLEESNGVNHQIRTLILNEAMTLKSVALSLVLPPSYLMFRFTNATSESSNDLEEPLKISLDDILRISQDICLWNMITDAVESNVTRFFDLDNNFVICQQLCAANGKFLNRFVKSLKDLIHPQWFLIQNDHNPQDIQIKNALLMLQQLYMKLPAWEKNGDITVLMKALESI